MAVSKKRGLGKGLGAYFGDEVVAEEEKEKEAIVQKKKNVSRETKEETEAGNIMVRVSLIEPNREQPRKKFDEAQLQELADSMKEYGVLQPLLVQKKGDMYEIVAGERRWRAAKLAELKEVPVIIREYTKQQAMEIALIENVQRADLNPIEEARAYQQLIEEFELIQEEIAERVGKSRAAVTNSMRLLKLDSRVQEMLIAGSISSGHARAILALEDGDKQFQVAGKVESERLSVRETEKLVKFLTKEKKEKPKEETAERDDSFIYRDLEDRMKSIIGTKVVINKKDKNKGRIEIEYYSSAELERIIELFESIQ